ncbi:cation:proton antiporter [Bosea sp. SSUT16]|jgi:monovalent cation:proton antiporter-2 (CPA2) family protein|uniref:Cation:proton antiporter n=1 Tax=Bosea spartocytisi TaxID=2773451 RepID=A0A927E9Y9_9HYPH|nr:MULTISPECIES: monovalent cation:proton antiporter-2 (CPA2) family protein [Bosea]MBD3846630.1 cation:proton antiporter [Bosea spartocytisi]MCT4473735.1 monovalent cation:proton antiporter-2 (CPA2) family protein [Bosea spartocytisi]
MADAVSHASYLPPILTFCTGAVIAVPLFRKLGLSAVLGYLAAGVVIGPSLLGVIKDPDAIRGTAEIGVVLLLFLVGLELQPSRLYSMRRDILGSGLAQMAVSATVIGLVGWRFGLSVGGAIAVGVALALSATSIALQLLEERGDSNETYGRRTFSILLFQDIAIAPVLALLPLLATTGAESGSAMRALASFGIAIAAVVAIVFAGRYLLNPFFRILANSGAKEVMTAAALLIVLGAALLMEHVGLSMAMGAFLAGLMLADSHFRHELEADIEPFRGVLLGLFFMAVGMSLDLKLVVENALLLAIAVPLLVLFKIAVVASILRASCSSTLEAIRAGALLSPAGEFAFVLLPLGVAHGLLNPQQAAIVTALAAISMLLGPIVAKLIDNVLLARITPETMDEDFDGVGDSQVMVIGFGRFGQVVTQALLLQHVNITVIDSDVEQIRAAARFGFKVYYGDGMRLDVLRAAGAGKARVICICVDDKNAALRILEMVKSEFPNVRVHARAFDRIHAIDLMKADVDYQMRETFESALGFGRVTLEAVGLTRDEADLVIDHVRDRDAQRMEIQFNEGIAAALNRVPRVTPEPLVKPKGKSKALTAETQEVIEDGGAEVAVGGVGEPER